MRDLKDKVAVVTGAGSGIGRSIAHALAKAGTHIAVSDIQEDTARLVRDEVLALGGKAIAVRTDVANLIGE